MARYGDSAAGLGIPKQLVVPTGWLREFYRLDPVQPYLLADKFGEALALISWRTEYVRTYSDMPRPRMQGSAIVIRPDLLHGLQKEQGSRLTLRDFFFRMTQPTNWQAS